MWLRFASLLLGLFSVSFSGGNLAATSDEIRICYEQTFQPPHYFGYTEMPETNPGLQVELVKRAVKQSGFSPSFYRSSWKRCIADLKSGQADALFALIWTKDRSRWAHFPLREDGQVDPNKRLWTGSYQVYVRHNSPLSWDGKQLKGLHFGIGAPLGYFSHQRLAQLDALSPINVGHHDGLTLVANKRMDGYVIDSSVAEVVLRQLQLETQLKSLLPALVEHPWYLVFSADFYQQQPHSAETIWNALAQVRENQGEDLMQYYLRFFPHK